MSTAPKHVPAPAPMQTGVIATALKALGGAGLIGSILYGATQVGDWNRHLCDLDASVVLLRGFVVKNAEAGRASDAEISRTLGMIDTRLARLEGAVSRVKSAAVPLVPAKGEN